MFIFSTVCIKKIHQPIDTLRPQVMIVKYRLTQNQLKLSNNDKQPILLYLYLRSRIHLKIKITPS